MTYGPRQLPWLIAVFACTEFSIEICASLLLVTINR